MNVEVQLVPDDRTMKLVIATLNLWQEANPMQEVALVPDGEGYEYRIIDREYKARMKKKGGQNEQIPEQESDGGRDHIRLDQRGEEIYRADADAERRVYLESEAASAI